MTSPFDERDITVVALCGPTGSGKSELAERLSGRFDGEIISADSMQVYRGMDIGTGKVPRARRSVPYHLLDVVEPGEPFSVALFRELGRRAVSDIHSRGHLPILCGGTGFYIQALLYEMDFPPGEQVENPIRRIYTDYAEAHGGQALHSLLAERDPESAALIHPNNTRRIIRALEMLDHGSSYAEGNKHLRSLPRHYHNQLTIGLSVDPSLLVERIDRRIDTMLAEGLIDEVSRLIDEGYRDAITARNAIGYKEFVPLFDDGALRDESRIEEAIGQVRIATHRYAKRQRSWFKRDSSIVWVNADNGIDDTVVDTCTRLIMDLNKGSRDEA